MPLSISFDEHHPFAVAAEHKQKTRFLLKDDGSHDVAAHLTLHDGITREEGFQLAENIAKLVNGEAVPHRFGEQGRTMHWRMGDDGIEMIFGFHKRDAEGWSLGNSQDVSTLTIITQWALLQERLFNNEAGLKLLMDQATLPERRSAPEKRSSNTARGVDSKQKPARPAARPVQP